MTGVVGITCGSQVERPESISMLKRLAQGAMVVVGWLTLAGVGVEGRRLCGVRVRGVVPGVFCLFGG